MSKNEHAKTCPNTYNLITKQVYRKNEHHPNKKKHEHQMKKGKTEDSKQLHRSDNAAVTTDEFRDKNYARLEIIEVLITRIFSPHLDLVFIFVQSRPPWAVSLIGRHRLVT